MKLKVIRVILALAAVSTMVVGCGEVVHLALRPSVTQTDAMKVGDLTRSWEEIVPAGGLPAWAPIIVVLSGIGAPVPGEVTRDHFVPYATAGLAELVYPAGDKQSWNAGGCCGYAYRHDVNDVAFLTALATRVDPDHMRPLYLVGYSNGGRMAYRMACSAPGVYNGYAIVKADPQPGCVVSKPTTIVQVASRNDNAVPYEPGDKGKETPAATVQVSRLRSAAECGSQAATTRSGWLTFTQWHCADGTRVAFALYASGAHDFPPPEKYEPAAAAVIWAFFSDAETIAPLP